jgi:hypothetical protein
MATVWPIIPAQDDRWWLWINRWGANRQRKPKYSDKTCSNATLSTTNRTWPNAGSIPGRFGMKPATNRLSYYTASAWRFAAEQTFNFMPSYLFMRRSFLIGTVWGGVQLGPLGTAASNRPIVPVPGDCDDGEIDGMIGRGNRSTRRKPAPVPLWPPQNPYAARMRTHAVTVRSQRLTAWSTARPEGGGWSDSKYYPSNKIYKFVTMARTCPET